MESLEIILSLHNILKSLKKGSSTHRKASNGILGINSYRIVRNDSHRIFGKDSISGIYNIFMES